MPLDKSSPDNPKEWCRRAQSNLVQAKRTDPEVYLEDLCFQAQQAVEKALKALIIHEGAPFKYVHNIARLMATLKNSGVCIPPDIKQAAKLTDYAVEARYPGPFEPVTQEEYEEALSIAERVLDWVEEKIQ